MPPSALDIDLSGVTSIDCDGERALVWLRDHGRDIAWIKTVCAQVMRRYAPIAKRSGEVGMTE